MKDHEGKKGNYKLCHGQPINILTRTKYYRLRSRSSAWHGQNPRTSHLKCQ